MNNNIKKILPYLITSFLVIGFWKLITSTHNYAWNPKGNETLILDSALTSIFLYKTILWLVTGNLIVFGILKLRQKKFKTVVLLATIIIIYHFTVKQVVDKECASYYYIVFQNQSVSESYIVRPIVEAGYEIGPILTKKIANKEMNYRRYAINGLQKIDYQPASKVMGKILFDTSEHEIYRADAYETLKVFNNDQANELLKEFKSTISDSADLKVKELGEYFYDKQHQ